MELTDNVAVITGAARGLGKAIAESLVDNGMVAALVDVLAEPLTETAAALRDRGGNAIEIVCDITSAEQAAAMADRVVAEAGAPAVLVNSAGSLSALGPVWAVDPARWIRDATVNLCGAFLVCRHVIPAMIGRGGGYVINLVGAGTDQTHRHVSGYDNSKAGVIRLSESIADEGAAEGLKAFALFPGTVRTVMTEYILGSEAGRMYRPAFKNIFTEGRDVEPDLAARAVLQLLSGRFDALSGRWIDAQWDFDEAADHIDATVADNLYLLRLRRG